MPELADLLASHFTVFNYDRRGRGDSGDTLPYAIEREIEDIEVLIGEAGGKACLFGHSSGAALVLEAARGLGDKVEKIALYEPPYNDDPEAQREWKTYVTRLTQLLATGCRGDAIALFMTYTGAPDKRVEQMRQGPFFAALEVLAPTLAYDHTALLGEEAAVPVELAAGVTQPALVVCGSASYPFMCVTARTLCEAMPNARLLTLEGQTHEIDSAVLAPALAEFFSK